MGGLEVLTMIILLTLAIASASVLKSEPKQSWKEMTAESNVHSTNRFKRYIDLDDKGSNMKPVICDLPDGNPGICKPTQQCVPDEDTKSNLQKYISSLCILDDSKMGICCADRSKEFGAVGLAGDLPAIASKDENNDILLKIDRAENRGCGFSTRPRDQLASSGSAARVWPWMASISLTKDKHYCGGALITDRHILTAAHCFQKWAPEDLHVRLGEYDFKKDNESRTYVFRVIEKIEHEEFDKITLKNDIAILKLHRPAVFNTYVWPICLPPPGLELVNKTTQLVGWGTEKLGGPKSHVLQEVDIPVWDIQKCAENIVEAVHEENYCVGAYSGGKDACQFDSGSPLMYEMPSGRWAAIGVVSWGVGCGEPNHPGIYTRTDKYLRWIAQHTQF